MFTWTAKNGVLVTSCVPRNEPLRDRFHAVQAVWSWLFTAKRVVKDARGKR